MVLNQIVLISGY